MSADIRCSDCGIEGPREAFSWTRLSGGIWWCNNRRRCAERQRSDLRRRLREAEEAHAVTFEKWHALRDAARAVADEIDALRAPADMDTLERWRARLAALVEAP